MPLRKEDDDWVDKAAQQQITPDMPSPNDEMSTTAKAYKNFGPWKSSIPRMYTNPRADGSRRPGDEKSDEEVEHDEYMKKENERSMTSRILRFMGRRYLNLEYDDDQTAIDRRKQKGQ